MSCVSNLMGICMRTDIFPHHMSMLRLSNLTSMHVRAKRCSCLLYLLSTRPCCRYCVWLITKHVTAQDTLLLCTTTKHTSMLSVSYVTNNHARSGARYFVAICAKHFMCVVCFEFWWQYIHTAELSIWLPYSRTFRVHWFALISICPCTSYIFGYALECMTYVCLGLRI
jgi:hypothetical protein